MKMRMHSSWRAVAPMVLVLVVLAGLAPVMKHRLENCNNNSLAPIWSPGSFGNVEVNEIDSRLEFHRKGAVPGAASAGILFNPHGFNLKKNFDVSFGYRFSINSIQPGRQFFMGAAFALEGEFPDSMTGMACGLLRDIGGLWIGLLRFENGAITDFDGVPVTQKTGTVLVEWNKTMDRFYCGRVGGPGTFVDGFYADVGGEHGNSPVAVTFGIVINNGAANFVGDNIYMDNIEMNYFSRAFTP